MPHWRPSASSVQCLRPTLANTRRVVYTVAGAALGIALTPVLAPAFLGIFGFSAAGPVAGQSPPEAAVALASNLQNY